MSTTITICASWTRRVSPFFAILLSACAHTEPRPSVTSNGTTAVNGASSLQSDLAPEPPFPNYQAIVDASDRSAEDRGLDAGRHPFEMLRFFAIRSGMKVAEISAGIGYTTELLARTVGPSGVVYGQNSPFISAKFAEVPWSERLKKPQMNPVRRLDRDFEQPFPPEVTDLDAIINVCFYHDTVWMKTDRGKMNRAVLRALKPGGAYFIIDNSAKSGAGTNDVESLHRIEESIVLSEVQNAGFVLIAEGNFLRNPLDERDWSASPRTAGERRGTGDRFALKFVKPLE
jgi:predicted methyltransferase